jgi:hypothetical protein
MYRTEGYLGRQEEKVISFPVTVAGFYRVVVKNTLLVHVPNVHFTINLKCGRETDFKEVLYANEEWKSHGMVISNLTEEERAQNDARSDDETWTRTISVTLKSHVKLGLKHAQYSVCIFSEFEKTYFEEGPITEDETRMIDVQVPRGIYKIFIGSEVRGQNLDVQVQSDVYGTHEPSLKKGTHNMICSKYFAVFKEKSPLLVRITIQGKVFLHNKPGKYKVIIARAHNSEIEVDTCEEFNRIANELMDATNTKDGDAICDIMQSQWKPIAKSFQSAFLQHDMEKVTQMAELLRVELLTLIRDASEVIPEDPRGEADPVQVADMKVRIDNFLMESKELSKLSKRAKKFLRFRAKKAQVKQLMKGVLDKLSDVVETKSFASWTDSSLLPQIYEQLQDVITETMSRFGSDPDQEIQADLMVLKTVNVIVGNQIKLQSQLDTILHTDNVNQIQSFLSRNEQQLARDAYERGVEHVRNLKIQQIPVIVIPKEEPTVVTPTTEPIVAADQPKRKRSIYEKQLANALAEKKKKLLEESKLASTVYYQSPMTPLSPPEAVESEVPTSHEQTCKQLHTKLIDLMKLASQFVERTQNGKLIVYFEYPFAESIDQIVRFFTTMLTVHRQYRKKKSFFSFHKKEEEEMEIIPVKEIIRGLSAEGSSFVKEFEKLSEVKQVSNEEQFDVTSLMVQYALHTDILGTLLTQLMHHNTRKYRSTMYDLYSIFNAYDPDTLMAVFGLLESLKFTFEFFNRDSNLEKFFSRVKKINIVDDSKSITLDPEMKPKTATSPTNVQQMVTLLKKTQESTKKIVRYFLHGKKVRLLSQILIQ